MTAKNAEKEHTTSVDRAEIREQAENIVAVEQALAKIDADTQDHIVSMGYENERVRSLATLAAILRRLGWTPDAKYSLTNGSSKLEFKNSRYIASDVRAAIMVAGMKKGAAKDLMLVARRMAAGHVSHSTGTVKDPFFETCTTPDDFLQALERSEIKPTRAAIYKHFGGDVTAVTLAKKTDKALRKAKEARDIAWAALTPQQLKNLNVSLEEEREALRIQTEEDIAKLEAKLKAAKSKLEA